MTKSEKSLLKRLSKERQIAGKNMNSAEFSSAQSLVRLTFADAKIAPQGVISDWKKVAPQEDYTFQITALGMDQLKWRWDVIGALAALVAAVCGIANLV